LTARIVARAVETEQKIGERSGLDPQSYASHSLRSGFATSAARANKSEAAIMCQGRWKIIPVPRRYVRAGTIMPAPVSGSDLALKRSRDSFGVRFRA
jgi:hypothetical protein